MSSREKFWDCFSLLYSHLKPWLLEVNSSPSLDVLNPQDEAVKTRLIADVLQLVRPLSFSRHQLLSLLQQKQDSGTWLSSEDSALTRILPSQQTSPPAPHQMVGLFSLWLHLRSPTVCCPSNAASYEHDRKILLVFPLFPYANIFKQR